MIKQINYQICDTDFLQKYPLLFDAKLWSIISHDKNGFKKALYRFCNNVFRRLYKREYSEASLRVYFENPKQILTHPEKMRDKQLQTLEAALQFVVNDMYISCDSLIDKLTPYYQLLKSFEDEKAKVQ